MIERVPQTISRPCPKPPARYGKLADEDRCFRSQATRRMRIVSAYCGRNRRSDMPTNRPKSNADRSQKVAAPTMHLPNALCRLTLELSRPVAGRRTCASVAQSTRPMPRHGVGLNELLGGGGCRLKPDPGALAENRSGKARTRTRELSAGCNRSDRVSSGEPDLADHSFRSRPTQRMQCMSAPDGLDRRSNVPTT